MGARELGGRLGHDRFVQVLGVEPGPIHKEGVAQPGVVNLVGVLLFLAGTDGVEAVGHLGGLDDHNVVGQTGVHRQRELVQRDAAGGAEVGHIGLGVDPGVGASCAGTLHRVAHRGRQGLLQRLRYRDGVLLHLPPVVGRAVVHQF